MRFLFAKRKNVLVEGLSDYLYLYAFSLLLAATGRKALPDDIYVTPAGGTRMVTPLAALFLGEKVRPLILLDADEAGRARQKALLKELYSGHEVAVLLLSEPLAMEECEIEDIVGEEILVPVVSGIIGKSLRLSADDREVGSLPSQIERAAARKSIELPDGWRAEAARRLVITWATEDPKLVVPELLDRAAAVIEAIVSRVQAISSPTEVA